MAEQKTHIKLLLFFFFFDYCELRTTLQLLHTNMHLFYGQFFFSFLKAVDL